LFDKYVIVDWQLCNCYLLVVLYLSDSKLIDIRELCDSYQIVVLYVFNSYLILG